MILRRVIEHFRKQEWTAIAIDFVIVVVGVFIGIQVANWNAARQDRADEMLFLQRLHDDVGTTDALSRRVRKRRVEYLQALRSAADVIFADNGEPLTPEQCMAISASHFFNVATPELPSFAELVSSGRLDIIRDASLRAELLRFHQTREGLLQYMNFVNLGVYALPSKYPELVRLRSYYDTALQEMQSEATCDLDAMRESQAFKNDFSENVDRYDSYVRDGLGPWNDRLDAVHAGLDDALGIKHERTAP